MRLPRSLAADRGAQYSSTAGLKQHAQGTTARLVLGGFVKLDSEVGGAAAAVLQAAWEAWQHVAP